MTEKVNNILTPPEDIKQGSDLPMGGKIWFTADFHFLHPKIVDICDRPTTIEEHDQWLLDKYNSVVSKKDTVYILGDVSMGSKKKTEPILDKMNGTKHLILGNHDRNIRSSTRFESISQIKNFNDPSGLNIHLVLCHYPMASWERKVHGSGHLYGHVHGRFDNTGMSFDVGVDANNWYPVSYAEVFDRLTKLSLDLF